VRPPIFDAAVSSLSLKTLVFIGCKRLGHCSLQEAWKTWWLGPEDFTSRLPNSGVGNGAASTNLEVLLEPNCDEGARVFITTSVDGFGVAWKRVFDRFFSRFDGSARIVVNDAGATPGAVLLRLEQAAEVIEQ
jgi:malonate decarboxylase delta subunit